MSCSNCIYFFHFIEKSCRNVENLPFLLGDVRDRLVQMASIWLSSEKAANKISITSESDLQAQQI